MGLGHNRKHIPTWPNKSERNEIRNFIFEHLVDSDYSTNPHVDFKIIYKIHPNLARFLHIQLLKIEVLDIWFDFETLAYQKSDSKE